jgi:hypothetical protein
MITPETTKTKMKPEQYNYHLKFSVSWSGCGSTCGKNTPCTRTSVWMHVISMSRDAFVTTSVPFSVTGESDWRISSVRLSLIGSPICLSSDATPPGRGFTFVYWWMKMLTKVIKESQAGGWVISLLIHFQNVHFDDVQKLLAYLGNPRICKII